MEPVFTYIEWQDAVSDTGTWMSTEDAIDWADNEDFIIKQAGYILKETDKYILIAGQYNEQTDTPCKCGNLHKIPVTWIRKRIDLTTLISS